MIEPRNGDIAEAETFKTVEGNMCGAAIARRRRSAGVEEPITQERIVLEPGRSGGIRRLVAAGA